MAAPYLTGNVTYVQLAAVVDVSTILTQLATTLPALSPAWTANGGNSYTSPVDSSGRQFTMAFSRISATNLQCILTDGSGRTLTRRAQIAAGGSTVNIYASQFYLVLDWLNGATAEGIGAWMLDESPELQTSHNMWMTGNSSRTAADALDGAWTFGSGFIIRSGGVFALLAGGWMQPVYHNVSNNSTEGTLGRTLGGSNLWVPIIAMGDSVTNIFNIYGRLYGALNARASFSPIGAEISVPIDQSNSAIFRTLSMSGNLGDLFAMRKT
jgi:hypothetical protein